MPNAIETMPVIDKSLLHLCKALCSNDNPLLTPLRIDNVMIASLDLNTILPTNG